MSLSVIFFSFFLCVILHYSASEYFKNHFRVQTHNNLNGIHLTAFREEIFHSTVYFYVILIFLWIALVLTRRRKNSNNSESHSGEWVPPGINILTEENHQQICQSLQNIPIFQINEINNTESQLTELLGVEIKNGYVWFGDIQIINSNAPETFKEIFKQSTKRKASQLWECFENNFTQDKHNFTLKHKFFIWNTCASVFWNLVSAEMKQEPLKIEWSFEQCQLLRLKLHVLQCKIKSYDDNSEFNFKYNIIVNPENKAQVFVINGDNEIISLLQLPVNIQNILTYGIDYKSETVYLDKIYSRDD